MAPKQSRSTSSTAITTNILSRLPVKSLVRFKSVSKSWSSLIRSPDLAAAHSLRHGRASLLLRYYLSPSPSNESGVVLLRDAPGVPSRLAVPSLGGLDSRFPKIVGSCNGLVCLDFSSRSSTHLAVWNPATAEFRAVPVRPAGPKQAWRSAVGFGFDPEGEDYRIVRVLYFQHKYCEPGDLPSSLVESYSTRTRTWSEVLPPDTETDWTIQEPGVAVNSNGALHWIAYGVASDNNSSRFIVRFDLASGVFTKLTLPASETTRTRNCIKVMAFELNQTIALAVYPQSQGNVFELWVLKTGDLWIRHCQIQPFGLTYVPVEIWRGSDLVITQFEDGTSGLLSYDPINEEGKNLFFPTALGCSLDVFSYTESVVSVQDEEDGRDY